MKWRVVDGWMDVEVGFSHCPAMTPRLISHQYMNIRPICREHLNLC